MGVLECERNGCDNIMSDRCSREHGYLCRECFEELVRLGPEANIDNFMKSYKQSNREDAARARFEVEFPER